MTVTFGDCVNGCGQVIGAATVGAMVGAPIAHYYARFGGDKNSQIEFNKETRTDSSRSTNSSTVVSENSVIPTNSEFCKQQIVSFIYQNKDKIYSFIIKNLQSEAIGAFLGAVTQVTFVALNTLAKRRPTYAVLLTIGGFAAQYGVIKRLAAADESNKDPESIAKGCVCISLLSVVASAALLNICSWVPRDMHFRAFGIVG